MNVLLNNKLYFVTRESANSYIEIDLSKEKNEFAVGQSYPTDSKKFKFAKVEGFGKIFKRTKKFFNENLKVWDESSEEEEFQRIYVIEQRETTC